MGVSGECACARHRGEGRLPRTIALIDIYYRAKKSPPRFRHRMSALTRCQIRVLQKCPFVRRRAAHPRSPRTCCIERSGTSTAAPAIVRARRAMTPCATRPLQSCRTELQRYRSSRSSPSAHPNLNSETARLHRIVLRLLFPAHAMAQRTIIDQRQRKGRVAPAEGERRGDRWIWGRRLWGARPPSQGPPAKAHEPRRKRNAQRGPRRERKHALTHCMGF
ncbi:hypothetical protein C2E23DRAFT_69845 [Lenzites betulinus]|nr:hypothetical protein C2E23DRAFT_69845 [Lenzites betulinus]